MLEILVNWGNPLRSIAVVLDSIAFNLIDNAYNLIYVFASGSLFRVELIQTVMNNTYVIIGIFALFRIALILVNAMINPDKLNEKGNGIGNVLANLVVMFVLLIMTPILFRELVTGYTKSDGTEEKSLQQIIVEGNHIQKIFLNSPDKGWNDDNSNPAATMRTIAASSLITIDKEVRDSSNCTGKCEDAIKDYDNMVDKNDFQFSKIAKYVSYQIEVGGEDVYIYNYKMFITFVAGIAVTYLLLNFALKLALRMVELTVLEMIAPMFIATYIDPKSAKSGPFSKWLKNVGTTYASLFIDIAIISIMLLFVSLLGNSGGLSKELTGFSKVVMLFAILIFAKKAPKWISDMIGIEGTGFKGIGKTLREDMLGGSLANKVALGATAIGAAAIGNRLANKRLDKEQKKAALVKAGFNTMRDLREKGVKTSDGKTLTGRKAESYFRKQNGLDLKSKVARNVTALGNAIVNGGQAGVKGENLMASIKGGIKASGDFVQSKGLPQGFISKTKGAISKGLGKIGDYGYGDANEVYERRKEIENAKNAEFHSGGRYGSGLGEGNIVEGNGDANKLFKDYGVASGEQAIIAQYCATKGMGVNKFKDIIENCVKDDKGNIITYKIEGAEMSLEDITKSLYVSGTGGAENLKKMFNTYQTNALANSTNSQEQYMQQASSYQTIVNSQNATAQQAKMLASAIAATLPDALKKVTIDASSVTGIKRAINNLNDNLSSVKDDNAREEFNQKIKELSGLIKAYDDAEDQKEVVTSSMKELKEAFDKLKPIVDGIKGSTSTEKEQQLAIELSKLEKTLEGIKKPEGDNK